MSEHVLKVQPPYFDALADGSKTFEVRRNDRSFQRGDVLDLREYHPARFGWEGCHRCMNSSWNGHETGRATQRVVSLVYSGDPRWGGIEAGYVVLALVPPVPGSSDRTEGE